MSDPIGSFSGLASGVQWRDLVDQLVALDKQRKLDPVTARSTLAEPGHRLDFLSVAGRQVSRAATALRDSSAFGAFTVSGGTSVTTGRSLLSAAATYGAAPGNYAVEVLDVARANKLSGAVVSSPATALGYSGEFGINGQKVTVVATDTLDSVRDKINSLNGGSSPSGVTASVLSTGSTQHRLVLSSDQTGASGIELIDDAGECSSSLASSMSIAQRGERRRGPDPESLLDHCRDAAMLGVSMPPPSTIQVGGRTISVDLTVDSLASIAAKISAAGGNATVTSESAGGKTSYRLVTSDTVDASTVDGQRTLEVLGFVKNGRSGVSQVVQSENAFTDGVGSSRPPARSSPTSRSAATPWDSRPATRSTCRESAVMGARST